MPPLEFSPIPRSASVAVAAGGTPAGVVTFHPTTKEWLAEAADQARYCPSFGSALNFIEAVLDQG